MKKPTPRNSELRRSSLRLTTVVLAWLLNAQSTWGQPTPLNNAIATQCWQPCPGVGSSAVNGQYQFDQLGEYCLTPNYLSGRDRYNFSDAGRNTPIADPSAMVFDERVYASGTADDYGVANFPIFESERLTDWRISRFAFPENNRNGGEISINGRGFRNLWAPHLYYDPSVNRIFISFTATECVNGICNQSWDEQTRYQSVYSVSISIERFRAGGYFADPTDGSGGEPLLYGYTQNDSDGPKHFDGGWQQAKGFKLIPTSGNASLLGCQLGRGCVASNIWRPGFVTSGGAYQTLIVEKRAWMHLDSFVFFDPLNGNRRYMFYTFDGGPHPRTLGSNIAAYPMRGPAEMEAGANEFLPMANARNMFNGRNGAPNGCDGNSQPGHGCIAEGPSVFERNGWYYLIVSRNGTGDSDYMLTYRKARSIQELALKSWDDYNVEEKLLAVSSQRGVPGGISFGHGEVFYLPSERRHYLILHRKDAQPQWWLHRMPFIKELSFEDATGEIQSLQDNSPNGAVRDLNAFITKRPVC